MEIKRQERGSIIPIVACSLFVIFAFSFVVIRYTVNLRDSIRLVYATTQIAQGAHVNAPYKTASLEAATIIARLHGFERIRPIETTEPQQSTNGQIKFLYNDSEVPHTFYVWASKNLNFLDKLLGAFGINVTATTTSADMGATSITPFVGVFADMSQSMLGNPQIPTGNDSPFDDYLDAMDIKHVDLALQAEWPYNICPPIDVGECVDLGYLSQADFNAMRALDHSDPNVVPAPNQTGPIRACCNWIRSLFIGYTGVRAHTFADEVPTPTPTPEFTYTPEPTPTFGPTPTPTATPVFSGTPPPSNTGYDLSNPYQSMDRSVSTTRVFRLFHPELPYWNSGDMTLTDSAAALTSQDAGETNFSFPFACLMQWFKSGIYPPTDRETQLKDMNFSGARLYDIDFDQPAIWVNDQINSHPTVNKGPFQIRPPSCITQAECNSITQNGTVGLNAANPIVTMNDWSNLQYVYGLNVGDKHICFPAWALDTHWYTQDEIDDCGSAPNPVPESPPDSICNTQYSAIRFMASDVFVNYKRIVQGFLISLSDVIPSMLLATFAGPTSNGAVTNEEVGDESGHTTPYRYDGTTILFNANDYNVATPPHMYAQPIPLFDVLNAQVDGIMKNSTEYRDVRRALGHFTSRYRYTEMKAHLDGSVYINSYPDYNVATSSNRNDQKYSYWTEWSAITGKNDPRKSAYVHPSKALFGVQNWLAPIEHPSEEWSVVGGDPNLPGRVVSNELRLPFEKRLTLDSQYNISFLGDTLEDVEADVPRQYFPTIENEGEFGIMEDWPYLGISMWNTTFRNATFGGIYDFPSLRKVDSAGDQTGAPYDYESVLTYAPALFAVSGTGVGGTDTVSALKVGREQIQLYKDRLNDQNAPGVLIILTDGAPNLTVPPGLNAPPDFNYTQIPTAPISDPNTHLGQIKAEIDALQAMDNTWVFLVYISGNEDDPNDPNITTFLDQFKCKTCKYKRMLLKISYASVEDFIKNLKKALSTIIIMIRAASILTDDTDV